MASKYRLNRYNWLGHKLLTQHKYENILHLKRCLSQQQQQREQAGEIGGGGDLQKWPPKQQRPISEHMVYLSCLALMQTSTRLDEVIYSLQQLNFEQNNQYFLLLCQCLLYLGNHESVIALCERVIAREATSSTIPPPTDQGSETAATNVDTSSTAYAYQLDELDARRAGEDDGLPERSKLAASAMSGTNISDIDDLPSSSSLIDSELKKLFQRADANHLVTEPRFWFIFGLCLEYLNRAEDALVAYKVSSNLALGGSSKLGRHHHHHHHHHHNHQHHQHLERAHGKAYTAASSASLNSFHEPHLKYAQLCIRLRTDLKRATQVLSRVVAKFPQNYLLNPLLSLLSCSAANTNLNHFGRAIEMLTTLENYSATNRNPSSSYNSLALRCRQRQAQEADYLGQATMMMVSGADSARISESGDDNKYKLGYQLIKAHISINNLVQDPNHLASLFSSTCKSGQKQSQRAANVDKLTDQLIELMRNSDVVCWQSSSLWNNLAVCYLLKGKLIASLSCTTKALELDSLDWRICYNSALACLQVGLVPRALCSLIAAKQLLEEDVAGRQNMRPRNAFKRPSRANNETSAPQMITTLTAICFDKLDQVDEARRLHIEAIRSQPIDASSKAASAPPIVSIINYLIFLHKSSDSNDSQTIKLKIHLLDLIEQLWLQRNQNDSQFNAHLLDKARCIGQELRKQDVDGVKLASRKTYAWMKVDEKNSIIC